MNSTAFDLSIIILNYNNTELTIKSVLTALDAAKKAALDAEILLIDNSAPKTARTLRQAFISEPRVSIIENEVNQGFAKANNQGIIFSKGRFLLILNNDVFLNAKCLLLGVNYLQDHPEVAIWAPQLVGLNGRLQASATDFPTLIDLVKEYLLFGRSRKNGIGQAIHPQVVDSVVGAFWLMPNWVVTKIGLLDESYFFTSEDVDYCKRIKEAGFKVVYDPRCSVVHIGGASHVDKDWLSDPYLHKYRIIYFRKHHGILASWAAALIIRTGLWLRRMKLGYEKATNIRSS